MASVGGGLMADIDTFNYGWYPQDNAFTSDTITIHCDHILPALVSGSAKAYEAKCDMFINHRTEDKYTHISDMIILQSNPSSVIVSGGPLRIFMCYGWRDASVLHLGTEAMEKMSMLPKWQHIKSVEDKKYGSAV